VLSRKKRRKVSFGNVLDVGKKRKSFLVAQGVGRRGPLVRRSDTELILPHGSPRTFDCNGSSQTVDGGRFDEVRRKEKPTRAPLRSTIRLTEKNKKVLTPG